MSAIQIEEIAVQAKLLLVAVFHCRGCLKKQSIMIYVGYRSMMIY